MLKLKTNESKQVGILYHYCNSNSMIYNIKNNKLTASPFFGMQNHLSSSRSTVSLTRNGSDSMLLQLRNQIGSLRDSSLIWRINIDGDKLSNNKKLTPYNYKGRFKNQTLDLIKSRQSEEFLDSDLNNLSDFVLNVKCYSFIDLRDSILVKRTIVKFVPLTREEARDILNTVSIVKKVYKTIYYDTISKNFPTLDSLTIALNAYIAAQ